MTHLNYEYRAECFATPPTAEDLNDLARDGWKLVSVTLDTTSPHVATPAPETPAAEPPAAEVPTAEIPAAVENHYIAYLERPSSIAAAVASGESERRAEFEWRPGQVADRRRVATGTFS